MGEERKGDGGGREFQRVLDALRERMLHGTYPLGRTLPAQRELAKELRVSRDTVQRVLKELGAEGWIETRRGSGSRVVRTTGQQPGPESSMAPADLGWFIGRAFDGRSIALDVYTLTSESLDAHIRVHAERIVSGHTPAPEKIVLRVLLPSEDLEHPYPRATGRPDDEPMMSRLREISDRHLQSLRRTLLELATNFRVPEVSVAVRRVPLTPSFKVYLLNRTEMLHSVYKVVHRTVMLNETEQTDALDVLGWGAPVTFFGPSAFVDAHQEWFDSLWDHLSVPDVRAGTPDPMR